MKKFNIVLWEYSEKVFEKEVSFSTEVEAVAYSYGVMDALEGITGRTVVEKED